MSVIEISHLTLSNGFYLFSVVGAELVDFFPFGYHPGAPAESVGVILFVSPVCITFEDVSALVSPVWSANCCDEHTFSRRGEELCMSTSTQVRCSKAADPRDKQLSNLEQPYLR